MNKQLDQIFSTFLGDFGALAPARLGEAADATPEGPQVDRFLAAVGSCMTSTRRSAHLLFAAYLVLLLGVLVLLYMSRLANSNMSIAALLGSSGVVGLVIIPVRMQSLWKDLAVMQMTLAILPGQPPKEQLALIKTLHASTRSGVRA